MSTGGRPEAAREIEAILEPRGPDGRGEVLHGDTWMLHRRLAVIDPRETSAQPFRIGDADVAYNGEIYNFRDLHDRLPSEPSTAGDTEVFSHILSAGSDVGDMMGMYAGVSVCGDTVRLTRDRFGIKPLYRAVDADGNLHVASQVRCFEHLLPELTIDDESVGCFLRFGNVHGGGTIFQEVKEVPAGTTETWVGGQMTSSEPLRHIEPGGDLKKALFAAMERHLVADTEIAVLLSAGLDSAVLAHLAKELGADPVCVTIAAVDGRDESAGAAETARHLGLRHEIVEIGEAEALGAVDDFFDAMDQPTIDGLNTFLVSRAVRSLGLKVALSGLGADELFGGYSSFRRIWATQRLRRVPAPFIRLLAAAAGGGAAKIDRWAEMRHDPAELASISREVFSPEQVVSLGFPVLTPATPVAPGDDVVRAEMWRYMSPTLLRDSDAFSMANSVELRVPFLDETAVAAALARTPRARALSGKKAIVDALGSPSLRAIQRRPKTGFELPIEHWLSSQQGKEGGDERPAADQTWPRWPLEVLDRFLSRHAQVSGEDIR